MAPALPPRSVGPRRFAVEGSVFGRAEHIQWIALPASGKTENHAELLAAQIQHGFAYRIRQRVRDTISIGTVRRYCETTGLPYDRTTKVLRGAVAMSLLDIAIAEQALGEVLLAAASPASGFGVRSQRVGWIS